MKKIIFILSLVLILALSTVVAFAQNEIIIAVDSNKVEFNDDIGYPFVDGNNRTQVPFRATLEKYGATVSWDNEGRIASAAKDGITVQIPIGEKYILKNDEKIETDTVALISENRTYLPIRAVIEAFGSDVQWDSALQTVVITTEAIDAEKILMDAYTKSNAWENYDAKVAMDMDISFADETETPMTANAKMNMVMNAFNNPTKIKVKSDMILDFQGQELSQPLLEMYVTFDESKFTTYMGMHDESGALTWSKSIIEDDTLIDLANYDAQANLELTKKFTKDVKYFGKYADDSGRTLLRIQNTLSGEIYKELLGTYIKQLASSTNTEDILAAEMLENLGDFQFILFIDEQSGEIVKYEMDLGSIYTKMFADIKPSEEMPQEAIDMLKTLKAVMVMEIYNINKAEDFDIPQEALDAPEVIGGAEKSLNEAVEKPAE